MSSGAPSAWNRKAWQEAIARHNHRVVVVLLARRIRLDHAQDLAQEAWTRLMQQQARGALTRIELPGLAIRQALFLAEDASRRERVRRSTELSSLLPDAPDGAPSPESRIMSRQLLRRAQRFLRTLPRRSREIFSLCYDDPHLSHAEAAGRLDVSVQHVRQTLYEVRKRLRQFLEEKP